MNREIPTQESRYFASFLLKKDVELDQVESLSDADLEKFIAETKTIAFIDTDVKGRTGSLLVVNRGYGNGDYKFNYYNHKLEIIVISF